MAIQWVKNPQCGWVGCLSDHEVSEVHQYDAEMREQIALSEEIIRELDTEDAR